MNNIHIYINEPENKEDFQISINDAQQLTNGTCDSIVFQEINYVDVDDIAKVFSVLHDKLSYNGSCFCQFSHLESILDDYNFHKIDENKLNDIIFYGKRNLLTESTMLDIIVSNGFLVKNMIYDEYLVKLELVKKHG